MRKAEDRQEVDEEDTRLPRHQLSTTQQAARTLFGDDEPKPQSPIFVPDIEKVENEKQESSSVEFSKEEKENLAIMEQAIAWEKAKQKSSEPSAQDIQDMRKALALLDKEEEAKEVASELQGTTQHFTKLKNENKNNKNEK